MGFRGAAGGVSRHGEVGFRGAAAMGMGPRGTSEGRQRDLEARRYGTGS